jgi:hypothetical protein
MHQTVEIALPYYEDLVQAAENDDMSIPTTDRTRTLAGRLKNSQLLLEDKGKEITIVHNRKDLLFLVPSARESHPGRYKVSLSTKKCTCEDHQWHGLQCKHYWAALLWFAENFSSIFSSDIQEVISQPGDKVPVPELQKGTESMETSPLKGIANGRPVLKLEEKVHVFYHDKLGGQFYCGKVVEQLNERGGSSVITLQLLMFGRVIKR